MQRDRQARASGSPAASVTDDEAREELADEPYKLELIGLKGSGRRRRRRRGRRGRRRRADHLRQPRRQDRRAVLEGPVPRPAPADHPAHPGVQADAHRRRVLARQREEPAAAAHLRHRLADQGRAQGAPASCLEEAEKRDHRKLGAELDLFSLPGRDRLRPRRLPPQGRHHPPGDGGLLAPAARGGGLRVRQHPAHHQGAAVRDLRPPATGTPTACTRPCSSTRARTTTSSR